MSFSIAATTLPYASVFGYRTILFILFHMMVALHGMAMVIVFSGGIRNQLGACSVCGAQTSLSFGKGENDGSIQKG
jgi:hypothetical protein